MLDHQPHLLLAAAELAKLGVLDGQAEEAATLYTSVFPNSSIGAITRYGPDMPPPMKEGDVLTVDFTLDGRPWTALNGGPQFKFTEAISFQVHCDTQEEIDHYWEKLSAGGDPNSQACGWLKDKYGMSWQINPTVLGEMLGDPDPEKANRVMQAMLKMTKIDIDALKRAYDQE